MSLPDVDRKGSRLRIVPGARLAEAAPALVGGTLNVVMKDGRTWHGRLLSAEGGRLLLYDLLAKKRALPFEEIEEAVWEE